jgi:hypothetical protein
MVATNREKLYRVSSSNHGIFSMPINQMIVIIKKIAFPCCHVYHDGPGPLAGAGPIPLDMGAWKDL